MPNKVVSKYFSTETGMDDSLSDFKEKKKHNTGPKNVKKPRNTKKPKRTRGQKDIRVLIKKQENDVLSYSKDFNKICKQAGVDVDSEELQLAIALSKSHHDVEKENSSDIETNSTEQLTSRQRILKIKTTLQEYGFRVPKTKITETNRRKRYKKQYKLLLTSETERRQIISDKYTEVLAGNIFKYPTRVFECDYSDKELYYKATNIAYEHIKNDDVYYVTDLFDKSCHKNCLLRNWSEIPGRPLSPTVQVIDINFDNIICSQHELDCILSGTVFAAQQIVINKNQDIVHNKTTTIDKIIQLRLCEFKPLENEVGHINNTNGIKLFTENITLKETNCYINSNTMSVSQVRCVSPDLFDDEVSAVIESPDNDVQLSGQTLSKSDNIHTYCMDLTECVTIDSSDLHAKTKLHTNNEINITNRKSNDLMEITECVSSSSSKQINVEKIDLTQSSNESNKQNDNILSQNENIEIMDLTQVKDCVSLPEKISYTEKDYSLDDTIILVDDDTTILVNDNLKMQPQKQNFTVTDLPDSICIDDVNNGEVDSSSENGKDQSYQSSSNSFKHHLYNKSYKSIHSYKTLKNLEVNEYVNELVEYQPDELDLTQSSNSSQGETLTNQPISNYSTNLGKQDDISIDYDEINNDIGSESINSLKFNDSRYESSSLEKQANKSNEDITTNLKTSKAFECLENDSNYSIHQSKQYMNINFTTVNNDENSFPEKNACNPNHDTASNPSKSSEVFEISDKEFNYSLHQSKHENFDFRDVSVMNDFSHYKNHSAGESRHYSTTKKRSLSESNLHNENFISPHKEKLNSETSNVITMPKENTKNVLNTPKNGEYIIKTNEITPMLDYASMSTPERHKELEKYGLKPFKRKRAIQLLTYVYNQTHPVIESHDICPSPSKRQKRDDGDKKCSSPKNTSKSEPLDSINKLSKASVKPIESILDVNQENDMYDITTEQPDIRNIECNTEDWFFQKREKAKLHSCRVPLHVAFHNYVSCRRRLREAILRYEPVNIDVIHKDLVATGYRYNTKDLLKFMDRKCITVKTADNSRNRKS